MKIQVRLYVVASLRGVSAQRRVDCHVSLTAGKFIALICVIILTWPGDTSTRYHRSVSVYKNMLSVRRLSTQ